MMDRVLPKYMSKTNLSIENYIDEKGVKPARKISESWSSVYIHNEHSKVKMRQPLADILRECNIRYNTTCPYHLQ